MAMITGFSLSWTGFVPEASSQSDLVLLAIRSLNGLVPFATILVGTLILARFGLTEAVHAEIRRALDERRADASAQ